MTNVSQDDIEKVNHLIEICRDGQLGFEAASQLVENDLSLRSELMQYSLQRQEFSVDLKSTLVQMGVEPDSGGSVAGALHRGWLTLKQSLDNHDKAGLLAECERGEDAAVTAFRDANAADLAPPLGGLVYTQYQAILRVHGRIRALRDAAKTPR